MLAARPSRMAGTDPAGPGNVRDPSGRPGGFPSRGADMAQDGYRRFSMRPGGVALAVALFVVVAVWGCWAVTGP